MRGRIALVLAWLFLCASISYASVYGTVRGVVHDPRHHPMEGAAVLLKARASDWSRDVRTDSRGEFQFAGVPVGQYLVTVSQQGFGENMQDVEVNSGGAPILHFALRLAALNETIEVSADPEWINPDSSATEAIVNRDEIARMPGADRTNSLAMITDLTPGAYMVHDQLHIRGGHQVTWQVDGVDVPNMNIASNVGPLFDPQDIDYLEVHRGGYGAEYGDRMYGVFNIVPRSGFERNNDAELALSYGSFNETNDHLSLGGHSRRLAYYVGLTGNRTDLGLQPPEAEALHDRSSSLSAFASIIYNPNGSNQFRLVASGRSDHYQVPNTIEQQDLGIRDTQQERDGFLNLSWMRILNPNLTFTCSPSLHVNAASLQGKPEGRPVGTTDSHSSAFGGVETALSLVTRDHNLRIGFSATAEREKAFLGLDAGGASGAAVEQSLRLWGNREAIYVEDQYRTTAWLTLTGGIRLTHFAGDLSENAASPRVGAALRVPGLNWILRGFYGRYYQPPPLSTATGPVLDLALEQGFGFLPLHGERDEQREVGLAIPLRGWGIDVSHFHTSVRNFFDHTPLGNSSVFFPVTIEEARIRGWEATIRSPRLLRNTRLRAAYSRQYAQGKGRITGGLTDFSPPETEFFYLDHDQRDTFSGGFETWLPWKAWAAGNIAVGSGFLDGDGPAHLPSHTTIDLSVGRSFGERFSVTFSALNVTNHRYLMDKSNTFGGTHINYPRQMLVSLRYRFHY